MIFIGNIFVLKDFEYAAKMMLGESKNQNLISKIYSIKDNFLYPSNFDFTIA